MQDNVSRGKKLTLYYALVQCVSTMAACTVMSFAAIFMLSREFTNTQVGLTLMLASIVSFFGQPLMASFSDQTRRFALRTMVNFGQLGMTLIAILLLVIRGILPTGIAYICMIMFFSVQAALVVSLSMEHINSGIAVNFSLARGAGSFSFAVLAISMGFLVKAFGTSVIMLANILLGVVGMILVATFPKAKKPDKTENEATSQASGLIKFALSHKRYVGVVCCVALIVFSSVLISMYMIRILQRIGGDSSNVGIAFAIAAFSEVPIMALFPLIQSKFRHPGTIMKLSGGFYLLKAVITLLAPSVSVFYLAQGLQSLTFGVMMPASVYYANQMVEEGNKNKGQVFMGLFGVISGILGNLLGGLMLDSKGGVTLMLTVGIAVTLMGVILLIIIDKPRKAAVVFIGNEL